MVLQQSLSWERALLLEFPFSLQHGQHLFVQVPCVSPWLVGSGAWCCQAQSLEVVLSLGCERSSGAMAGGPELVLSEEQRGCGRGPGLTLAVWGCWRLEFAQRMDVCAHRLGCAEREHPSDSV